ncbi:MAG TPA: M23 family metallopeptidase [Mycobacteriales bacterium]|nr:M23 family metallopeptidase [Mycobacteriales bacterium]
MPTPHLARHVAPPSPPRPALTRAVLFAVGATAFGGLALMPSADLPSPLRVVAAAAATPIQLSAVPGLTFKKNLDGVEGVNTLTERLAKNRAAAANRASRNRKTVEEAARPRAVRPNGGGITSRYGPRWGRMHRGIDIAGAYGSPVYAISDGTVVSAGREGGYGNMVQIRHTDGIVTAYAHMSRILVSGGRVRAGDIIGKVGSTGHSTGPHLHLEVRVGGHAINPVPWLRSRGVRI